MALVAIIALGLATPHATVRSADAAGTTYTIKATAVCCGSSPGAFPHTYTISAAAGSTFDLINGGSFSGTGSYDPDPSQTESITGTMTPSGALTATVTYLNGSGYVSNWTAQVTAASSTSGTIAGTFADSLQQNGTFSGTIVAASPLPDLTVPAFSAPASAAAGSIITITATIANQGSGDAAYHHDEAVLSTSNATAVPTPAGDIFLAAHDEAAIAAGASYGGSNPGVPIPSTVTPGNYYICYVANYLPADNVAETSMTNNRTCQPIAITVGSAGGGSSGGGVAGCVAPPAGLVSWWTGDGTANDLLNTNNPTQVNAGFAAGVVGQGIAFNGIAGQRVLVPDSPSLDQQNFTIDLWATRLGNGQNEDDPGPVLLQKDTDPSVSGAGLSYSIWWSGLTNQISAEVGVTSSTSGLAAGPSVKSAHTFPPDSTLFIAITHDTSGTLTLYVNGVLEGQTTLAGALQYGSGPLTMGGTSDLPSSQGFPRTFNGVIDEVEFFSRALSAAELNSIYGAGAAGKCKSPVPSNGGAGSFLPDLTVPSFTAPASAPAGSTITITATVANQGKGGAAYHHDEAVLNASNATDVPTRADDIFLAAHDEAAIGAGGSYTGSNPSVPIPSSVTPGSYYICYVTNELPGDTVVETSMTNNRTCQATTITTGGSGGNGGGQQGLTAPAITGIAGSASLSGSPVGSAIPSGGVTRYGVLVLTGTGTPGATVSVTRADPCTSQTADPIPGTATVAADGSWTLVTNPQDQCAHTFTAVQSQGGVTSGPSAGYSVMVDGVVPTITIGGVVEGQSYASGVTPAITVADLDAYGQSSSYVSGIDGSKTTYTLDGQPYTPGSAIAAAGAHTLVVSATDMAGNIASQTVHFAVGTPPAIGGQPAGQTVKAGQPATFSIAGVTGSPAPGIQWQLSSDGGRTWTNIQGATGASYTTSATTGGDSGTQYRAALSNGIGGPVYSTAATLTVVGPPAITGPSGFYHTGSITLTGTGIPGATINCIHGGKVDTTIVKADGTWSLPITVAAGDTLTITQSIGGVTSDPAGSASGILVGVPPVGGLGGPVPNGGVTGSNVVTLTGAGVPGLTVQVSSSDPVSGKTTILGTTTVKADGTWSYTTPAQPDGDPTFTAIQLYQGEPSGNADSVLSSGYHIVIDTTSASVTVTNPAGTSLAADGTGAMPGAVQPGGTLSVTLADLLPKGTLGTPHTSSVDPSKSSITLDGSVVTGTITDGKAESVTAPTGLGKHTLSVVAVDKAGNKVTKTYTFYVFSFASGGQFVLGDVTVKNATPGSSELNFWGSQWWKNNTMSVTPSGPAAFKGFDDDAQLPACGQAWTTDPGNSSNPPDAIPGYMAVIVASQVSQSGSTISGDITQIVIVKTDPGYAGNPGHAGTGTVVAVYCGGS